MHNAHSLSPAAPDVWKQAVDLQKHFNDVLWRIRGLCFTYLGGLAAVAGLLQGALPKLHAWHAIGLVAPVVGLYVVDRFYYHSLLIGAVAVAMDAERSMAGPLRLSTRIRTLNRKQRVLGFVSSGRAKVTLFYGTACTGLLVAALGWWGLLAIPAFWALEQAHRAVDERATSGATR